MSTQAPEIDGVTLINDFEGAEPRPGEMRRLRITEAHDYDVVGTLLAAHRTASAVCARAADPHFAPARAMKFSCPICKKEVNWATRFSLLQRTLPHDRSGQLGRRKVRVSSIRRSPPEPDEEPAR